MEDFAAAEDIVPADIFLYHIDNLDGSKIGELSRRSVRKYFNTVRLLPYNSRICCVSKIITLFKTYRCPSFDHFIKAAHNLEQQVTTCKKIEHVFPGNMYQLRETLFDKLNSFHIFYFDDRKLFKNMEIFDIRF